MGMIYNALGITVTPKDGEMFYFNFWLDNEESAHLNAPQNVGTFKEAKTSEKLLDVLDGCFCAEGGTCDEDGEYQEATWTLKDLVEFYDYDELYPKFKKKVNALKTLDQIACITVFTNNAWDDGMERRYKWTKYDFAEEKVKHGFDTAKATDCSCIDYEPSETEMLYILAEK